MSLTFPQMFPAGAPPSLRPYQVEAKKAVLKHWADGNRFALVVSATGTGKSVLFGDIARNTRGRVLLLVHRDLLVDQGRGHLERACGEPVEIEQAQRRATLNPRVIVASKDSLYREKRLSRWPKDHFETIIVDEAHRSVARTYQPIFDHFDSAKVLGVTATPDRGDGVRLKMFGKPVFVYQTWDAIDDGWLVEPIIYRHRVTGLLLDNLKIRAGDLEQEKLDEMMGADPAILSIIVPAWERLAGRRAFMFTTSKKNAARTAQLLNARFRSGCAEAVTDDITGPARKALFRRHREGDFQFLISVNVITEGYDDPKCSAAVWARPTKIRNVLAQGIGRVLRPWPGTVDGLATAEERKAAIAASAKPNAFVLDFTGTTERHNLACPEEILSGKAIGAELAPHVKKAIEEGSTVREAIEYALREDAEIRRLREVKRLEVEEERRRVDARRVGQRAKAAKAAQARREREFVNRKLMNRAPASLVRWLAQKGHPVDPNITHLEASRLAKKISSEIMAVPGQVAWLTARGVADASKLTYRAAAQKMREMQTG